MLKKISDYKREITRALKAAGTYSKGLDFQILSLASALRTLDMANTDIDGLAETTVLESTRYGEKLAPHPVFKIQKDAHDSVTRQMKALGLTAEQLTVSADDDPLCDLTRELKRVSGKSPEIVRPTKSTER